MIIKCNQCLTHYQITSEQLKPTGKKVKCTRCGNIWFEKYQPIKEEILTPNPIPINSSLPMVVENYVPIWFRFIPILFLCMIIISTIFFYQSEITKIFPNATEFYDILGISDSDKIKLNDVTLTRKGEYIDINGLIENHSSQNRMIPNIIISLTNEAGKNTSSTLITMPKNKLEPNEKRPFHKRLTSINPDAKYLIVAIGDKFDILSMKLN